LTPYCGLEVQKTTQALQAVKGPENTFDGNTKWARTLPSLIYFSRDIHIVHGIFIENPLHKREFKYQSERQSSCPLGISIKGIGRAFN
jgi:hypothetical protein